MNLVTWLREQIDHDEQVALHQAEAFRAILDKHAGRQTVEWLIGFDVPDATCSKCKRGQTVVSTRVDERGRLFHEHANSRPDCETCSIENPDAQFPSDDWLIPAAWPCATLRALASVFSDRPGYTEAVGE
jgi:hypothetical protein